MYQNHYPPVSVIPAVSKIIERVIHSQLSVYLENNSLVSHWKFGFCIYQSMGLAAALFADKIRKKVNEGKHLDIISIFCDLAKAFDAVNHAK